MTYKTDWPLHKVISPSTVSPLSMMDKADFPLLSRFWSVTCFWNHVILRQTFISLALALNETQHVKSSDEHLSCVCVNVCSQLIGVLALPGLTITSATWSSWHRRLWRKGYQSAAIGSVQWLWLQKRKRGPSAHWTQHTETPTVYFDFMSNNNQAFNEVSSQLVHF